jgi:hypothetical protein
MKWSALLRQQWIASPSIDARDGAKLAQKVKI